MYKLLNHVLVCLVALVAATFASCDSDEPENQENRANYELVFQQVVSPEGECRFPAAQSSEIGLLGCESKEIAEGLVSALTLHKYDGERYVILDLNEYGKVTASPYEENTGKYFSIEIELKGCDKLKLLLASMEYFNMMAERNNEGDIGITFGYVYKCPKCGACFTFIPDECLDCKYPDFSIPQLSVIPIPSFGVDEVDVNFNNKVNNN